MKKDFSPDNSHEQNVKIAIDKILGQETDMKRRKKSVEDQKRIYFKNIIENIIAVEERSSQVEQDYSLDFTKYNASFFVIIDDLFKLYFTKEQINVINFYLYDRYTLDGKVLDLTDSANNIIKLDTPDDLWFLIKSIENGKQKSE
jgi:hypothetical protein